MGGSGTLLVFLGALFIGFVTEFAKISPLVLGILLGFVILGEALEQLSALLGARFLGASKRAAFGAAMGGFVGMILGLMTGIGILILPLVGIFVGAFIVELVSYHNLPQSIKSGMGGLLGRLGAVFSKVILTLVMIVIVLGQVLRNSL